MTPASTRFWWNTVSRFAFVWPTAPTIAPTSSSRARTATATIFQMLEGRFVDDEIRRQYVPERLFKPLVLVSLGVDADLSGLPHALVFPIPRPVRIAGEIRERLQVRHYAYDPMLAPKGKSHSSS